LDEGQEESIKNDINKQDLEYYEVIGKGSAGIVYRGTYKPTNEIVAIKCINFYEKDGRKQLLNDIKSLAGIDTIGTCPFLVRFYGAYLDESRRIFSN